MAGKVWKRGRGMGGAGQLGRDPAGWKGGGGGIGAGQGGWGWVARGGGGRIWRLEGEMELGWGLSGQVRCREGGEALGWDLAGQGGWTWRGLIQGGLERWDRGRRRDRVAGKELKSGRGWEVAEQV